jgi:Eco57I restriction-modification methylase
LSRCRLPDRVLADIIFPLSHEKAEPRPKYINYRDLSVQQLGSIYERLLEFDVVAEGKAIAIRLNPFARKGSGSYYTPEPLVKLIIERAVGPLVAERLEQFRVKADELSKSRRPLKERLGELAALDPASRILELKVCDPAMGSGHFLVSLVDWMADRVLAAIDHAAELVDWADEPPYESPLIKRIATIRSRIQKRAKEHNWPLPERQLDERNIVRRMILKRCVYGVDLNPMAVELAKVSLWLHTFTVGAPLSFLDHHLRCGDSLFGEHVRGALDWLAKRGTILVTHIIAKAKAVATGMAKVEHLTDADIAEVRESETNFESVESGIRPIVALLDFIHVQRWQDPKDEKIKTLVSRFFDGQYGDPLLVLDGRPSLDAAFAKFYEQCRRQIAAQRFLHWEVAFPGVWSNWESAEPQGGFDAVIGNPPWDRIKFQEVEWFAARKPEIAKAQRAADRKKMVVALKKKNDPLALAHEKAVARAEAAARVARSVGDYPLLSGGDTNIYSLFVERGTRLINSDGLVGLLTPSEIASDKTAADFFKSVATTGRLGDLFDFENKKVFFPDVHASFKFCAIVVGGKKRRFDGAHCAFFLHSVDEIGDPERSFTLEPRDFARVNPNTGTAPIFRTRRDAEITKTIYERLPVLVERSPKRVLAAYPINYIRMFDMTNDSNLFVTRAELEKSAYPIGANVWRQGNEEFVSLYEGKMVQMFDHRAANVVVNLENLKRPASQEAATLAEHQDPSWVPEPQFWVSRTHIAEISRRFPWTIGFKHVTASTNVRSMIAAMIPSRAAGNSLPIIIESDETKGKAYAECAPLLLANLCSIPLDYVLRQKVQGQNLNWFIIEQLAIIPRDAYARTFGKKSAVDIVKDDVLALTYTANDMEPFARDMGYTGKPFKWDEADRARRRARLDALYFMLYFPSQTKPEIETLRETAHYIFSTFPIVEREDIAAHGRYLSRDLCLATINALAAGDPDANISL